MGDLVKQLRALARAEHDDLSIGSDAADEIEHLHDFLDSAHKQATAIREIEKHLWSEGVNDRSKLIRIKVVVDRILKAPDQHDP